jgi:RNA polymerase sigma-70 factor, ECF subfamily
MKAHDLSQETFIGLIAEHRGIIHKIIRLYEDVPETRRDLEQEVMLQAWKSFARFRGESQFSTWLYRVALNTVLTCRRKETRLPMPNSLKDSLPEPTTSAPSELSERLWLAIKALDDIDKSLITMHLDGYRNDEIAKPWESRLTMQG